MLKTAACLLLLALAPQMCGAANWFALATTTGLSPTHKHVNGKVELDTESIARKKSFVKAWFQITFDENVEGNSGFKPYRSQMVLQYFSCEERTIAVIQSVNYDYAGLVTESNTDAVDLAEFSDVVPDTIGEIEINVVCKSIAQKAAKATEDAPPAVLGAGVPQPGAITHSTPIGTLRLPNCGEDYYPAQSLRLNQQGAVVVKFCIGANNKVDGPIEVVTSSGFPLIDEAAGKCIAAGSYRAGTVNGQPIRSCKELKVGFAPLEGR